MPLHNAYMYMYRNHYLLIYINPYKLKDTSWHTFIEYYDSILYAMIYNFI